MLGLKYFMKGYPYCNLNVIGILNGTRTGRPLCFPGVILGNLEIMRCASFSKFLSGPRILMLVIWPSFAIIKLTYTLPWIPISWAISGYLKFLRMCLFIFSWKQALRCDLSTFSQPGKIGTSSITAKGTSTSSNSSSTSTISTISSSLVSVD